MKHLDGAELIDSFFSHIVEIIPSSLYSHANSEDPDDETRYVKNRKLPLSADERKAASKRKLEAKYQPNEEQNTSTTDLPVNGSEPTISDPTISDPTSHDLEDLRKRLQARILGFKSDRTSKKERTNTDSKKKQKKKKSSPATVPAAEEASSDVQAGESASKEKQQEAVHTDNLSVTSLSADGDLSALQYNKMLDTNATRDATTKKQVVPVGNKMQRLKRLLEETEKKRERLKELGQKSRVANSKKGSTDEEQESAERAAKKLKSEMWNDIVKVAAGDKSIIVPTKESQTKLKKAMKRIERKKKKSADKWADRLDKVTDDKNKRIKKREDNLQDRKNKKQGIPAAKKSEGDTSTSNGGSNPSDSTRPGFEGKKKGLLNN